MSTATEPGSPASRYVDFDEFIDYQIHKAQTGIKTTDLLTALIGGAAAVLLYLLMFAIFDHWVIDGGFGRGTRLILLFLLVLLLTAWCTWKLVVPYLRRVTALYAAREIESADPEFQNMLLTLVDLQRSGREVPEQIKSALEKRAARSLSRINVDDAVDRRLLMQLSYVLLGLVVATSLYTVLSPKKLSNSLWRALIPTSRVVVDTRTRIDRVDPGDAEVLARSQLPVFVDLSGELPDVVTLQFTTADHRFVNEPLTMREADDGLRRYRAILTGENGRGILQDLTYRIQAGDALSPEYHIRVKQPPTATVHEVLYEYPAYMGFDNRQQPGGSIDAWEGTWVTVRATTNMPVTSAVVQFRDDEDSHLKAEEIDAVIAEGTNITARWQLRIRSDGTQPQFYRIQVRNDAGESDPEPTLYALKIRPDEPPRIVLLHPESDIERPANAVVPLMFEAADPDFLLRTVILRLEQDGTQHTLAPRLYEGPPYQQSIARTYDLDLSKLPLRPGDRLTYWLEARDNMEPFADRSGNRSNTPRLNIDIVEAIAPEEVQQQLEQEKQELRDRLQTTPNDANDEAPDPENASPNEDPLSQPPQPGDEPPTGDVPPQGDQPGAESQGDGQSVSQQRPTPSPSTSGNNPQTGDGRGGDEGQGLKQSDPQNPEDRSGDEPFDELLRKLMELEQDQKQGEGQTSPEDGSPPGAKTGQQGDEQPSSDPQTPADPSQTGDAQQTPPSDPPGQTPGETGSPNSNDSQGSPQSSPQQSAGQGTQPDPSAGGPSTPGDARGDAPPSGDPATAEPSKDGTGTSPATNDSTQNPATQDKTNDAQTGETSPADPSSPPPTGKSPEQASPDSPSARPATQPQDGQPPATQPGTQPPQAGTPQHGVPIPGTGTDPTGQKPPSGQTPSPGQPPGQTNPGDPTTQPPARSGSQPKGPDEPLQGAGRPDGQRSDQPQTGEGGSSQQATQGTQGSDATGAGDSSNQPGGDTPAGQSTGQPGQQAGEGSQSGAGGEQGGQGGGDESSTKQDTGDQPPMNNEERGENTPAPMSDGGAPPSDASPPGGAQSGGGEKSSEGGGGGAAEGGGQPGQQAAGGAPQGGANGGGGIPASNAEYAPTAGAGGGDGNPQPEGAGSGEGGTSAPITPEEADLANKRKAANLVLQKLQEQLERGEMDADWRERLGVTDEQLRDFGKRLEERLADQGDDLTPEAEARRRQFEETLRTIDFRSRGATREGGDGPREAAAGFGGARREAPPRHRSAAEAYREMMSRKAKPAAGSPK